MTPLPPPPPPTDVLVSDLRFKLIADEPHARVRHHVAGHVADRVLAGLLLTDPGATAQAGHALVQAVASLESVADDAPGATLGLCPHVGALIELLAYTGLELIDRAQAATTA